MLVYYKADLIILPLKINLLSPWYTELKNGWVCVKQQSLTQSLHVDNKPLKTGFWNDKKKQKTKNKNKNKNKKLVVVKGESKITGIEKYSHSLYHRNETNTSFGSIICVRDRIVVGFTTTYMYEVSAYHN